MTYKTIVYFFNSIFILSGNITNIYWFIKLTSHNRNNGFSFFISDKIFFLIFRILNCNWIHKNIKLDNPVELVFLRKYPKTDKHNVN